MPTFTKHEEQRLTKRNVKRLEKADNAIAHKEDAFDQLQADLAEAKTHLDKLVRDLVKAKQNLKCNKSAKSEVVQQIKNDLA